MKINKSINVKKPLKTLVFFTMILSLLLFMLMVNSNFNTFYLIAFILIFVIWIRYTFILNKQIKQLDTVLNIKASKVNIVIGKNAMLQLSASEIINVTGKGIMSYLKQSNYGYLYFELNDKKYKIGIVDDYEEAIKKIKKKLNS